MVQEEACILAYLLNDTNISEVTPTYLRNHVVEKWWRRPDSPEATWDYYADDDK